MEPLKKPIAQRIADRQRQRIEARKAYRIWRNSRYPGFAKEIIEFYQQTNDIIDEMPFIKLKPGQIHTSIPYSTWRALNAGTP